MGTPTFEYSRVRIRARQAANSLHDAAVVPVSSFHASPASSRTVGFGGTARWPQAAQNVS